MCFYQFVKHCNSEYSLNLYKKKIYNNKDNKDE